MFLKQKSLFLVFLVFAAGYVMEDGKSPPMTLKSWLPEKKLSRLKEGSQSGYIAQRAQSRNSNGPVRTQARSTYFDSHSHMRTQEANFDAHLLHEAQDLLNQARGTFQDSSLFQQIEGGNFLSQFKNREQSRNPFEQHEIIDVRSPISKSEREQYLFWGNSDENHGPDTNREVNSVSFGGGGIQDNVDREYQRQFFSDEDFKSTPVNDGMQSNRVKRGRDHFNMQQNQARVNDHEFDDTEPDFFVGESDYSHEITHDDYEEEIRYESPFTDEGASNDQIDENYDFFSNQEAFKDTVRYYSSEVEGDQKTNIIHPADFEVDFSNDPDFSVEETHVKDTSKLSVEIEPSRLSLDSFEVGFDDSFTNKKNPVRSLEALESQEYNNKKIKTIYRVSRGKDEGGSYPVITSVQSNIEDIATLEREGKNLQDSLQPTRNRKSFETTVSGEEEPSSSKQNRRGLAVGHSRGLQDLKKTQQIENRRNESKRSARHIQHHHVHGYTEHSPELVPLTNGVPTYFPNVPKEKLIVITNPPEVHQTVEVHHQHVPHYPDESILLIQSPPKAFVEVPKYHPDVHELPHNIDPHQPQQYLEVNIPKHVKVRKIRKGYIYEIHLTEEEHLHQKEKVYDHYPPGHHSRFI